MRNIIMAIDDSNFILATINQALRDDYDVRLMNSAVDAIEHLKTELPDLIIIDIAMPKLNGYEMAAYLKKRPETSEIPVVFLFSGERHEYQTIRTDADALDWIEKPFHPGYLKKRVSLYIDLIASKRCVEQQNEKLLKSTHALKQLLEDVAKQKSSMETLIRFMPGGLFKYAADPSMELDFVSKSCLQIFGMNQDVFRKTHHNRFDEMIYYEDRKPALGFIQKQMKSASLNQLEYRIVNASGELIWVYHMGSLVTDPEDGKQWFYVSLIDITNYKKLEKELKHSAQQYQTIAEQDLLTKLYNKGTLEMMINDCLKQEGKYDIHALLFIDIDNFKTINDTFGHLAGDEVLMQVSNWMREIFRSTDILGRFGGDEFIVLLRSIPNETFAAEKAALLSQALHTIPLDETGNYLVSSSIGIALYPKHGVHFSDLYQKADEALYLAKAAGKDGFRIYDHSSHIP